MRFFILLLMTLPLFSCVEVNVDDLRGFVVKTKSQVYLINDQVPKLKKIDAIIFTQLDHIENQNPHKIRINHQPSPLKRVLKKR